MSQYTIALIGLGGISKGHLAAIENVDEVQLVGVCDRDRERLATTLAPLSAERYEDADKMLAETKPDIVAVLTPNASHAAVAKLAAGHQPRAIICEKPMSLHFYDAVEMVELCDEKGIELIVNHQRRLNAGAVGRQAIEDGLIGDVMEIEARCPGDLISDGVHAVDLVNCLTGDVRPSSVWGAVSFKLQDGATPQRYGHAVESSAMVIWRGGDRVRCSVATGELAARFGYQHIRIIGSHGELWHPGGRTQPKWFLNDGQPGTHAAALDDDRWYMVPVESEGGPWRCLNWETREKEMATSLRRLVNRLDGGDPHPMNGRGALLAQEIVNAAFLSALRREETPLPLPKDTPFVIEDILKQ